VADGAVSDWQVHETPGTWPEIRGRMAPSHWPWTSSKARRWVEGVRPGRDSRADEGSDPKASTTAFVTDSTGLAGAVYERNSDKISD